MKFSGLHVRNFVSGSPEPKFPCFNTSLYRITRQCGIIPMQTTEKKIRLIRDKLSRIGIGEKSMNDEAILLSYSINSCGNLCSVHKIQ
jgi:hypothetical protein